MEKKGMESKDSGSSGAADRSVRLFVSGYDTSLPKDDARSALTKHFSSFGKVFGVNVIPGLAMVYLRGEPLVEKVEKLNGGCECDAEGGCKIVVDELLSLDKPRKCPAMGRCVAVPDFVIQRAIKLNAKDANKANKPKNAKRPMKAKNANKPKKAKK